jgi:hypothetical protein
VIRWRVTTEAEGELGTVRAFSAEAAIVRGQALAAKKLGRQPDYVHVSRMPATVGSSRYSGPAPCLPPEGWPFAPWRGTLGPCWGLSCS